MGKSGVYSFTYFTKDKYFIKSHIIEKFGKIPKSKFYIPDDINPLSISPEYLFTVSNIFYIIYIFKKILETVVPKNMWNFIIYIKQN